MNVFNFIDLLFLMLCSFALFFFLVTLFKNKKNRNYPIANEIKCPKFAVLIPARDESKVIEGLLVSLVNQTFPIAMEDVYVIVEDRQDKTCQIVSAYHANVVVRKNLTLKRKGYALDEGIQFILNQNKKYDAYFIFDADNQLDSDYFLQMQETFQKGYDIGVGYRNTKNGNASIVATCSTLTFSMINTLGNQSKNKDTRNVTISGTGFYIKGKFIEEWGGFPFHTLTEDYELTLYSSLHNMTSFYNEKACFYDEQPTSWSVSVTQRTRWIKGFFEARQKYVRDLYKCFKINGKNSGSQFSNWVGVKPYIVLVIGICLELIAKIVGIFFNWNHPLSIQYLLQFIGILLFCYFILMFVTLIIIRKEKKQLNLTKRSKIKGLLFNPIFLSSYIICALRSIFHKKIEWTKINHG